MKVSGEGKPLSLHLFRAISVAFCAAWLMLPHSAEAAAAFTSFDGPGSNTTIPTAINSSYDIVGFYSAGSGPQETFLRTPDGTMTTLDITCGAYPSPAAITKGGIIAGQCTASRERVYAYLRETTGEAKRFKASDDAMGTYVLAMNDRNAMTGYFYASDHVFHGFLWQHGGATTFDAPGAYWTYPYSINYGGIIAGTYFDTNITGHGFIRAVDGSFTEFDATGAGSGRQQGTYAQSLNDGGETVGYIVDASNVTHGFVRDSSGTITEFDVPHAGTRANQGTRGTVINKRGEIAGTYVDAKKVSHSFLRLTSGEITAFDPPGALWSYVTGLTADDSVIGYYADSAGLHGYIRTP